MKPKLVRQLVKLRLEHFGDKIWCGTHGLKPDSAQFIRVVVAARCWSDNRMSWWNGLNDQMGAVDKDDTRN